MTLFWILAAAMTLVAAAFVLAPGLRAPKTDDLDPTRLNAAVIRQQIEELERDLADGRISQEDYDSARTDLERELLYAVEGRNAAATRSSTPRARWLVVAAGLAVPAAALILYAELGARQIIPLLSQDRSPATAPPTRGETAQAPLPSIEEMVARLEEKLKESPDNDEGWVMLGRSYTVMGRYGEAAQAYAKASALREEKDADVLAAQAEALSLAEDGRISEQTRRLIGKALALDAAQPRALWLSGFDAFQQGDYRRAIAQWRRLAAQVDPASEDHSSLQQAIQIAHERMGAAADAPQAPNQTQTDATPTRLTVEVNLDESLAQDLQGDETVFIFARAAEGPRMPLAIVRKRVSDLPATVVLDDSMAMTPRTRLSAFDQVVIQARVSRAGTAQPRSGDLEGTTGPVPSTGTKEVRVTIDRVVP